MKASKISDLTPDSRNANKGTEHGSRLLEKSLRELGAGRSILADRNGNVIAGNKTLETASAIGMDDIIIVPSDGTKLIVVQRTDLDIDSKQGRELALADNKVSQENLDFDEQVIAELADEFGIDAHDWGFDIEQETAKRAIETVNINPFKQVHVLVSFSPDVLPDIEHLLLSLKDTYGVSYEQSAN